MLLTSWGGGDQTDACDDYGDFGDGDDVHDNFLAQLAANQLWGVGDQTLVMTLVTLVMLLMMTLVLMMFMKT